MPEQIRRVAQKHLKQPKEIKIASKTATATTIRQRYWQVTGLHKLDAMTRLLEAESYEACWCSCVPRTPPKSWPASWPPAVTPVRALHGDIPQKLRERTVDKLRQASWTS